MVSVRRSQGMTCCMLLQCKLQSSAGQCPWLRRSGVSPSSGVLYCLMLLCGRREAGRSRKDAGRVGRGEEQVQRLRAD